MFALKLMAICQVILCSGRIHKENGGVTGPAQRGHMRHLFETVGCHGDYLEKSLIMTLFFKIKIMQNVISYILIYGTLVFMHYFWRYGKITCFVYIFLE